MSTLRVNTIQDTAGSGSPAINGLARAWVNFNGTNTVAIRAASNVSSITDNGTGNWTVNFANALADSNYSTVMSARPTANYAEFTYITPTSISGVYSTTAVSVRTAVASPSIVEADCDIVTVAVFR